MEYLLSATHGAPVGKAVHCDNESWLYCTIHFGAMKAWEKYLKCFKFFTP